MKRGILYIFYILEFAGNGKFEMFRFETNGHFKPKNYKFSSYMTFVQAILESI